MSRVVAPTVPAIIEALMVYHHGCGRGTPGPGARRGMEV